MLIYDHEYCLFKVSYILDKFDFFDPQAYSFYGKSSAEKCEI